MTRFASLRGEAGIANDWIDANGAARRVAIDTLRGILAALGFPCQSKNDIAESGARLGALSNARGHSLPRRPADRFACLGTSLMAGSDGVVA